MKKTIAMCAMMLNCILSTWGVELTAPTYPSWVTPESGGVYFLYNVEADKWLACVSDNDRCLGVQTTGKSVYFQFYETKNNWYLKFANDTYGISPYNSDGYTRSEWDNGYRWNIQNSGDGTYRIQIANGYSRYNADQWLGWGGVTTNYVYYNRALGENTSWKFAESETAARYCAERELYDVLSSAEPFHSTGMVNYYLNLYTDRANATIETLTEAAKSLTYALKVSQGYEYPSWNEYPILFQTSEGNFGQASSNTWALPDNSHTTGTYFEHYVHEGKSSRFSATVTVDQLSAFIYQPWYGDNVTSLEVYVDGVKTRSLRGSQINQSFSYAGKNRFFETLEAGTHTITWIFTSLPDSWSYSSCKLFHICCVATPQITVSLLEPGSLGTEVLYNTDHIKNVRRLKVKGKMNDDDWAKIQMMTELFELDLSEAETDYVPECQFDGSQQGKVAAFLRKVILPEGLTEIKKKAFQYTHLESIQFPSTLTTIGEDAFHYCSLREAILPDGFTSLGEDAFSYDRNLEILDLGESIQEIPKYCFRHDNYLKTVILPNSIKWIEDYAFCECCRMQPATMPTSLQTIGDHAFDYCYDLNPSVLIPMGVSSIGAYAFSDCDALESVVVPSSVGYLGNRAFSACDNLTYAELSVAQYDITEETSYFYGCPSLKTLRLNSATVVKVPHRNDAENGPVDPDRRGNITLKVPSFLVNSYKLDSYWYNFKLIEGFDPSEIDYWTIENSLALNRERMTGTPSIFIGANGSLKINGTDSMPIQDLTFWSDRNGYYGRIFSNADGVTVGGDLTIEYYTHTKQQWRFVSLPFNMKVGDITSNNAEAIYSIAYYDGASRAEYGATGSWKKYQAEDVIPAGTGFIFCSNKDKVTWYFHALDDESKQNATSIREFQKTLEVNEAENKSNRGWNLIGNPYQCFYNNHCLNFTAPITVWNPDSRNYVAYSLTDDDYAIRPNEAFFVQCPSEEYKIISFPLQGRQMTDVVESQNAVKAEAPSASRRKLINIQLVAEDEGSDQTRIVLNEMASVEYEISCDAGKFLSMDGSVPQLFTLDAEGTQYAINERPMGEGKVQLGFSVAKDGTYTIRLSRCDDTRVMLTDNTTGTITEITDGEYRFEANAGTDNDRFEISFLNEKETGISGIKDTPKDENVIYNLSGQRVNVAKEGDIYIQNGKKLLK